MEEEGESHNLSDFSRRSRLSVRVVSVPDRSVAKAKGGPDLVLVFNMNERARVSMSACVCSGPPQKGSENSPPIEERL